MRRYDFSDPQAGKDVCDRMIAAMKSHMRRYVNEGSDVQTASQMKSALDSYGGVKGCYVAVASVNERCQIMSKHAMTGVQSLSNFLFEPSGIRAWKAYGIGAGKFFPSSQLEKMGQPQQATDLTILQDFGTPDQAVGRGLRKPPPPATAPQRTEDEDDCVIEGTEDEEGDVFSCPEEGCVKKYLSHRNLQNHLDIGKHYLRLESETSYDSIKRKWADACHEVSPSVDYVSCATADEQQPSTSGEPTVLKGWALKKARRSTRFTDKVKLYLRDVFLEGEETEKKANPSDVASNTKSLRSDETGNKLFTKDEWLTTQQVTSYFSRLASLNRSGRLRLDSNEQERREQEQESSHTAVKPSLS